MIQLPRIFEKFRTIFLKILKKLAVMSVVSTGRKPVRRDSYPSIFRVLVFQSRESPSWRDLSPRTCRILVVGSRNGAVVRDLGPSIRWVLVVRSRGPSVVHGLSMRARHRVGFRPRAISFPSDMVPASAAESDSSHVAKLLQSEPCDDRVGWAEESYVREA